MKKCVKLTLKLVSLFVALSAVICLLAVFRDEVEDFLGSLGIRVGKRGACEDDEYADFADVL